MRRFRLKRIDDSYLGRTSLNTEQVRESGRPITLVVLVCWNKRKGPQASMVKSEAPELSENSAG